MVARRLSGMTSLRLLLLLALLLHFISLDCTLSLSLRFFVGSQRVLLGRKSPLYSNSNGNSNSNSNKLQMQTVITSPKPALAPVAASSSVIREIQDERSLALSKISKVLYESVVDSFRMKLLDDATHPSGPYILIATMPPQSYAESANTLPPAPSSFFQKLLAPPRAANAVLVTADEQITGHVQLMVTSIDPNSYLDFFGYPAKVSSMNMDGTYSLPRISNLVVDPTLRRSGIGKQLIEECISISRAWGYDQVFLEVQEHNVEALNFYARLGFEQLYRDPDGERFRFNGYSLSRSKEAKIAMRKVLR